MLTASRLKWRARCSSTKRILSASCSTRIFLPIFDAGEENGRYYVVMEHVRGARTLATYCKPDHLLRVEDVIEIIYKCAKALHYAHGRGLIHRDIKPSNVMLTPDNDVRIIDFGIALLKDADMSAIQGIAGSPSYMSPEQVQSSGTNPLRLTFIRSVPSCTRC